MISLLKPALRYLIVVICSSAGRSWRSPPAVSTMTVSRPMLLVQWRLQSHLRSASLHTAFLMLHHLLYSEFNLKTYIYVHVCLF